ncbi:MAG: DUF4363 family protein [Eubacterium sp.]
MKRVYAATAILIISVLLCVGEQRLVEKIYTGSTEIIQQAIEASDSKDYKMAQELCAELDGFWQNNHPLMSAMIDHGSWEDASLGIKTVYDLAVNESDGLTDALTELKNQVEAMRENQKITFGNIF